MPERIIQTPEQQHCRQCTADRTEDATYVLIKQAVRAAATLMRMTHVIDQVTASRTATLLVLFAASNAVK